MIRPSRPNEAKRRDSIPVLYETIKVGEVGTAEMGVGVMRKVVASRNAQADRYTISTLATLTEPERRCPVWRTLGKKQGVKLR